MTDTGLGNGHDTVVVDRLRNPYGAALLPTPTVDAAIAAIGKDPSRYMGTSHDWEGEPWQLLLPDEGYWEHQQVVA
jgi:hypothetical protein